MLSRGEIRDLQSKGVPDVVVSGYFAALAISSIAFYVLPGLWIAITATAPNMVQHTASISIWRADNVAGIFVTIGVFVVGIPLILLLTTVVAMFLTAIPFGLFYFTSVLLKIKHWLYFVLCGALMGMPVSAFSAGLFRFGGPIRFYEVYQPYAAGALGGLTYWWVAVRTPN